MKTICAGRLQVICIKTRQIRCGSLGRQQGVVPGTLPDQFNLAALSLLNLPSLPPILSQCWMSVTSSVAPWLPLLENPEHSLNTSYVITKVEGGQGSGDDTALNGIELFCTSGPTTDTTHSISSTVGPWGKWTVPIWCRNGFLCRFQLRVEKPVGKEDDTAANNIKFWCTDGSELEGQGLDWGEYGTPSSTCRKGISGIVTRVEPSQGNDDDTALNDVQFECAEY
ncbi:Hypothetical predicted protein [Pelobates cultripes]|uniref:Vitelline membrane outer layer 1-like protein n=1 Tax=Pelobates cultripes TaxID=61616 RepID=A0AAD1RIY0_PELCU|nr:Hypothetical predicted protein [Pelobates cultripes]